MAEPPKRRLADVQYLKHLVPIGDLTTENMRELASKTYVEELTRGKTLFAKGDLDNFSYYLLSGEVALVEEEPKSKEEPGKVKVFTGGTNAARFPLDHHRPRHATAKVRSDKAFFIRVDNNLLDVLLTWDQNAGYMVSEIDEEEKNADEDDEDWMTTMLHSNIFHRIPPSNIQQMFMRMEAVHFKAGELVIQQGDEGDFYYYIKSGRAVVTHVGKTGKAIKLAELGKGSNFGEEALIADAKRNANVTMLTDGVLMRLGKQDFMELLRQPVIQKVNFEKAKTWIANGEARWLDVRLESERKNSSIPNSLHIPLYLLRIKAAALPHDMKYIVYCDTGRRSSSATYLLTERGFDAFVLEGGLIGLKQHQQ